MVSQRTHAPPIRTAGELTDNMLDAIDKVDVILKYQDILEKVGKGTLDVPGFFKAVSHDAAMTLVTLMHHGQEKIQLEAAKDILDRAGYNKTSKFAVASVTVDHQTSKLELINLIMSSAKKAGLAPKDKPFVEDEIDVTPKAEVLDLKPGEWTASAVPGPFSKERRDDSGGPEVCGEGEDPDGDDHD